MYKYKLLRYSNAAVLSVRLLFPKPINAGVPCAFSYYNTTSYCRPSCLVELSSSINLRVDLVGVQYGGGGRSPSLCTTGGVDRFAELLESYKRAPPWIYGMINR